MKKIYRIVLFIFLLLFFVLIGDVHANSISSIKMNIYVDNQGNANVTEIWDCYTSQGTESYHPYYNLGNSTITDLSVSEENRTYLTLPSWDTRADFDSKAYRCGLHRLSNGIEICWGISSYGQHTYTVNYTITNFVSELTDSQMIYWTLIPYDFSTPIGSVYIKIYSDFDYPFETPVWGYGNKGGTCYVYDGYIEMGSDGKLKSDEYMTILVKFPKGTFNTSNLLDYNFDHYLDLAEKGAKHYNKMLNNLILPLLSFLTPFVFIAILASKLSKKKPYNFGKTGNKVPKNVPLFRDIPCKKDIFRAYFVAENYNLMKKKTDFLGAMLLKWLKEDKISLRKQEVNKVFKKEDTTIVFNNAIEIDNSYEKELYNMFFVASKDGILEEREFERWCSNHYSKILNWFDDVLNKQRDLLVTEGKIEKEECKKFGFKSFKYTIDSSLMEEAKELYGLKKFFDEFTLIDKREAIEVALFEDYLIFAQILGVSKKVASQFKKLYPELIQDYSYDYDDIILLHSISNSGISHAYSAKARAESYSSGGGGFSSGGGRRRLIWWSAAVAGGFR